ncbi:MAG: hypothetical protein KBT27_01520 [Prevotellaceae bacterium]|nr:hypothetical protein [Candidatus Faecinaster equi]
MRYEEYLQCAEKHLNGCVALLSSYQANNRFDSQVWLELYYLSGYIVEGITIYSAYKLNNWNPNDDIKYRYNLTFTQRTNLDFYYKRNGAPPYYQNRPSGALSVQGHKFQDIVKNLLKPNPSFNNVPYLGLGQIDKDVESLIDNWSPNIRYMHKIINALPVLNKDVMVRLMDTCRNIYYQHI